MRNPIDEFELPTEEEEISEQIEICLNAAGDDPTAIAAAAAPYLLRKLALLAAKSSDQRDLLAVTNLMLDRALGKAAQAMKIESTETTVVRHEVEVTARVLRQLSQEQLDALEIEGDFVKLN